MNKVLTIVIPTYNMEEYLDKCLTSLIVSDASLMRQLEVLVVIDGAKDRSSEIAHGYQDRYPDTFKVIDKENGNYGSCINRGLKEAQGKYIKILDADDCFDSRYFAGYLKLLMENDVDLVINNVVRVNPKDVVVKKSFYSLPQNKVFGLDSFSKEMRELYSMHRVAYRTEKLRQINYVQTEGISYTDQEWVFRPISTVDTVVFYDYPLYRYLMGREGQTMDPKVALRSANHHIIITKKMISDYKELKNLNNYLQVFIDERLLLRCSEIYYNYLSNDILPMEELVDFDNYVQDESFEIYKRLEDVNLSWIVNKKYIKEWHNRGRNTRLSKFDLTLAKYTKLLRSIKWRILYRIR